MKGWRGSPARHALAAKGISLNVERPVASPMPVRPQRITVGEIYDRIRERAFTEAASSNDAERLLADRSWLKDATIREARAEHLTLSETAHLENDLLEAVGMERSIGASLVELAAAARPGVEP